MLTPVHRQWQVHRHGQPNSALRSLQINKKVLEKGMCLYSFKTAKKYVEDLYSNPVLPALCNRILIQKKTCSQLYIDYIHWFQPPSSNF